MSDTVLAIDLGGTRCRAGVASSEDPVNVRTVGEWPAPATCQQLIDLLAGQFAEHGATRLGIGVPGLTDGSTCCWIPNLPYLDGFDIAAAFPATTVGLGQDAALALLAEARAGAAIGLSDAILLAIGTGIGSAVLAGGRIVAGSRGAAASFGWASADVNDLGDDQSGWLERHSSGRALDAAAMSIGLLNGAALVESARAGEAKAVAALAMPMRALGTALVGAVALLNPAAVILAGGVAASLDVLAPMILEPLREQLPPHLRGIELRAGLFGARAGLVGAAFAGVAGASWRTNHG